MSDTVGWFRILQLRLLVFLHGTALMHAAAVGVSRDERVRQVRDRHASIRDLAAYVPAECVVEKLRRWKRQGAEIAYLSSHRAEDGVEADRFVLARHRFPRGRVVFRAGGESYGDVVARVLPDVLVEDDCESIGAEHMAYPLVEPRLRSEIVSVVLPEFAGFCGLPDSLDDLAGPARAFRRLV